jgi:hypothetical protein
LYFSNPPFRGLGGKKKAIPLKRMARFKNIVLNYSISLPFLRRIIAAAAIMAIWMLFIVIIENKSTKVFFNYLVAGYLFYVC